MIVTCDNCTNVSESGWGDTALCLECEDPRNVCSEHLRTFVGQCPLEHGPSVLTNDDSFTTMGLRLSALTDASITALDAEVGLALYLLARIVKDRYPTASHIVLEASDQGDWMVLGEVRESRDGEDIDGGDWEVGDVIDDDIASHLYQERRHAWAVYEVDGRRRRWQWILDLQRILDDRDVLTGSEAHRPHESLGHN